MAVAELKAYVSGIDRLIKDQRNIIMKALKDNEAFIIQLQKEQMQEGKKGDGSPTPFYVANSKSPSAPGRMKYFDTGDFYRGFDAVFGSDEFTNTSTDSKTDLLISKWGELFGFDDQRVKKLQDFIIPVVQKENIRRISQLQ